MTAVADRSWPDAERSLHEFRRCKNRDLNMLNLRARLPEKDSVEVRILPGDLDTDRIAAQVAELRAVIVDAVF